MLRRSTRRTRTAAEVYDAVVLGETAPSKRMDTIRDYCRWFARLVAKGEESPDLTEFMLDRLMRSGSAFCAFGPTERHTIEAELRGLLLEPAPSRPAKERNTGATSRRGKRGLIVSRASDIKAEKIEWLWPGRIARGKHTTIAGDPGTGKSQVMISIITAVTAGGQLPCDEGRAPLGSVIVLAAEDGIADTIVPRLLAARADPKRVHIVTATHAENGTQSFNLQADLDLLEQSIEAIGDVCLVCVDPISSYLGKVDSHKNAELRAVLEPIGRMAERKRVAILSVTHFSKGNAGTPNKALYRVIGSIAFTAAPRAAFVVLEDPDNKDRRLFLHGKNNLAAPPQGLAFRLAQVLVGEHEDIVGSYVEWESGPVLTTADQALGSATGGEDHSAMDEAVDFLREELSNGEVETTIVDDQARRAGISKMTLKRARAKLGVVSRRQGFSVCP
jgi:putative DNA primase/helicase